MTEPISEAFALITELGLTLGAAPLSKYAGCWEHNLGCRWLIAVNGHRTPMKTSAGCEVPPFHAYVERHSWPGGLLTPFGGTMIGGLEAEDDLIAELKRAILQAHDGHPTPLRCKQCGGVAEEARRCFATPVCFSCLPPPKPLPVAP